MAALIVALLWLPELFLQVHALLGERRAEGDYDIRVGFDDDAGMVSNTDDASPSIMEVFAHVLAEQPERHLRLRHLKHRDFRRVAVCSSGHLRTFPVPGVHTGVVQNLIQSMPWPGARVDFFMDGIFGNEGHRFNRNYTFPNGPDDPRLVEALATPGLNLKSLELYNTTYDKQTKMGGDCYALQRAWERDGVTDRHCNRKKNTNSNFYQMMFMDRCIQKVLNHSEEYDMIVRTRPDITLFKPMPWTNLSRTKVSYMPRWYGGGEDWFFAMPIEIAREYWDEVMKYYLDPEVHKHWNRAESQPDHRLFPRKIDNTSWAEAVRPFLETVWLPAVIVRSTGIDGAECNRVPATREEACAAMRAGNLTEVNHTARAIELRRR